MKNIKKALAGIALAAAALTMTGCAQMNREDIGPCVVQDKDRSSNSEGSSVYQVYTDCGVLRIKDNVLEGKFNAADDFARIKVGEAYNFETIGWRNGFFSIFPNIVKFEKVTK